MASASAGVLSWRVSPSPSSWAGASAPSGGSATTGPWRSTCPGRRGSPCGSCSTAGSSTRPWATPADSVQRLRIGTKKDGTLTAIHLDAYGTAGTGTGAGCGGPAKNMYPCPNVLIEEADVFTHAGPAAAFPRRGTRRAASRWSRASTSCAEKIRMSTRWRCATRSTSTRTSAAGTSARQRRPQGGRRRLGEQRAWGGRTGTRPAPTPGRSSGASGWRSRSGTASVDLDASCEVRMTRDGLHRAPLHHAGSRHRHPHRPRPGGRRGDWPPRPQDVAIRIGDTRYPRGCNPAAARPPNPSRRRPATPPGAPGSSCWSRSRPPSASRPTISSWPRGTISARSDPAKTLSFKAAARLHTEEVAVRTSRSEGSGGFQPGKGQSRAGIGGLGGVQFAAVAVDTETGIVKVERVVAVHDCGRPLNPLGDEDRDQRRRPPGHLSTLYRGPDPRPSHTGRMVNANFEQYKIAGAPRDAGDRGPSSSKSTSSKPPTPPASASRPPSPPPRQSPTPLQRHRRRVRATSP